MDQTDSTPSTTGIADTGATQGVASVTAASTGTPAQGAQPPHPAPQDRCTLGEYAAKQLARERAFLAKDEAKRATVENWMTHINALPATLSTKALIAIDEDDCKEYVAALQAQHQKGTLAATTMTVRKQFLRTLLQRARQEGLIPKNPCAEVLRAERASRGRGVDHHEVTEAQTLSAEQVVTVFLVAATTVPPLVFVLVAVMLLTGMLGGEARALQLGDLQLDHVFGGVRRPRICVRRIEFHGTLSLPGWEERYVDVPPLLEAILRWWIARLDLTQPTDWLFPGTKRRTTTQRKRHGRTDWCVAVTTVNDYWHKIRTQALPGTRRTLTALHHAFSTLSLQLGEDALYVSVHVGHRTVKYTRKVYKAFIDVPNQGTRDASSEAALMAALGPAMARAAEVAEQFHGQPPTSGEIPTLIRRAIRSPGPSTR